MASTKAAPSKTSWFARLFHKKPATGSDQSARIDELTALISSLGTNTKVVTDKLAEGHSSNVGRLDGHDKQFDDLNNYIMRSESDAALVYFHVTDPRADGGLVQIGTRVSKLEEITKLFNDRLAETHDMSVTGHGTVSEQRINELIANALQAGARGGDKAFMLSLRQAKVDDKLIIESLVMSHDLEKDGPLDLSDAQLFTELYTAFTALQHTVALQAEQITRINRQTEGLGEHGEHFLAAQDDIEELRSTTTSHGARLKKIENVERADASLAIPAIVSVVVGVIAAILWHAFVHFSNVDDKSINANAKIGKQTVVAHVTQHSAFASAADSILAALCVGIVVGGLLFVILGLIALRTKKEKVTTVTKVTEVNSNAASGQNTAPRSTGNGQVGFIANQMSNQNPGHPHTSQANSVDGGEPTQVMHQTNQTATPVSRA